MPTSPSPPHFWDGPRSYLRAQIKTTTPGKNLKLTYPLHHSIESSALSTTNSIFYLFPHSFPPQPPTAIKPAKPR